MGKINKVKRLLVPVYDKKQDKELVGDIFIKISIQCLNCKHLKKEPITCKAFEDGIPKKILDGDIDHRKPYKGDNGIQYEKEK